VSLEPVFWELLNRAAKDDCKSINVKIGEIDSTRDTNLSSAIRTYLVTRYVPGHSQA
jgi:predicted DNA-binding ribbon-helix-helix protein